MRLFAIAALILLAGCATAPPTAPLRVDVTGPKFPRAQFDCGARPLPPDPTKATGKTAATYENRLGAWGQGCSDRLQSIAVPLAAAGQVEGR